MHHILIRHTTPSAHFTSIHVILRQNLPEPRNSVPDRQKIRTHPGNAVFLWLMNWTKGILIGGGGVAAILLARKAMSLNDLKNQLVVESNVRIHRVNLGTGELILAADVKLKNPSGGTISVSQPVVSIFADKQSLEKNEPLISSDPSPKNYRIPKEGSITLEPILLPVGVMSGFAIIRKIIGGQPFELFVNKATRLNDSFNYSDTQTITLRAKAR